MRTGQVARAIGIHPQTLRRWERERRLRPAKRNPVTKQRIYDDEEVASLREELRRGKP